MNDHPIIHLHTHSHYSFLEGISAPQALVAAAAEDGMPALALSDHRWLTGAIEFYKACQEMQIQAIIGLEVDVRMPAGSTPASFAAASSAAAGFTPASFAAASDTQTDFATINPISDMRSGGRELATDRLVLLATNQTGWSNLCRISSGLQPATEDPNLGVLAFDSLAGYSEGLICLTGGSRSNPYRWLEERAALGRPERWINRWLKILDDRFPGRVYLELTAQLGYERLTAALAQEARRAGFPLVAAQNIYYLKPEEARQQQLVTAIRLNERMNSLAPGAGAPPGSHFLGQAEMKRRFADTPEALRATNEIAELCRLEMPLGRHHYPAFPMPEKEAGSPTGSKSFTGQVKTNESGEAEQQTRQLLRARAFEGAERLYATLTPELVERLEHELAAIESYGYAALFLIVQDILQFARRRGIPFSSRGSAASSLVAHCLGISSPDPIRLNLYFERFLNPARATPPDIDTDLCSQRRDEVIHYVYRRYGEARVAMVGTINRFRRRSALRETAKALGFEPATIKRLTENLPYRWRRPGSAPEEDPFATISAGEHDPAVQACLAFARNLIGQPRHLSVHPGGMVIAPGELNELAATLLAPKGVRITQFDLEAIEQLGLVKIDLLGIRGLSVLGEVAQKVQASHPERYASPSAVLEGIPLEDELTSDLIQNGKTIGCFQIESPGMRTTLKEIQARSSDDLMVALALYRPGPLTGGLKNEFVTRFRARQEAGVGYQHIHPALEPLLEDTYGVILYQEQVLRIAHDLAGLSLEDSDLLRRAMSHFNPGKQMEKLQARFIEGACERTGMSAELARSVWDLMAAFAGYGFPKAHAASYAQIAWRAAWCKAHHPALFMAAVLANWGGYYPQRVYLTETRRAGIAIRPPQVNYAEREVCTRLLDGVPVLWMGLDQVRDLTRQTQRKIIQERPFKSLSDFLVRVDPRPQEAANLARIGALAEFGSIPRLLAEIEAGWRGGQLPLFSFELAAFDEEEQDWSLPELVAAQEAILGVGVSAHALELVGDKLEAAGVITSLEANGRIGQRVRLAGMRLSWRRGRDLNGSLRYDMALEDLEGMMDVLISAAVYRRAKDELQGKGPFVIEGWVRMEENDVEPILQAERIWAVR